MTTTLDDIAYERHLEELYKSYIESLEQLANSSTLNELKKNLEKLYYGEWSENLDDANIERLKKAISDVKNIDQIFDILKKDERRGKRYFIIGVVIGFLGIIIGILL